MLVALLSPPPAGAVPALTPTSAQVRIAVTGLSPTVITRNTTVRMSGLITNTTNQTLTEPILRLQAGRPLRSRAALARADARPPLDSVGICDFHSLGPALAPHQTRPFSTACGAKRLGMSTAGVYPLLVNINAVQADGSTARVGEMHTYLPFFPIRPRAPVRVSWMWPVVDQPRQLLSGDFTDNSLATSFGPTGRLYRVVRSALDAPADVPLLVPIDPNVVVAAATMAAPDHAYRVRRPTSRAAIAAGRTNASAWLGLLRALIARPGVTVLALPYGNPDIVALRRAGLSDEIGRAFARGGAVLASNLGVTDAARIAWPPGGELDAATLYALAPEQFAGIILAPDALRDGAPSPTPVAALRGLNTNTEALITDATLDTLIRPVYTGGFRLNEQRFAAELAAIAASPGSTPHTVLVAPAPRFDPGDRLAAMVRISATVPWAQTEPINSLIDSPPVDAGPLVYARSAGSAELPSSVTEELAAAAHALTDFAGALDNNAVEATLAPAYDTLLSASSASWRTDPAGADAFRSEVSNRIRALTEQVFIVQPAQGTYSLASSGSPLVVTVENTLDSAITVRINITARGTAGFRVHPASSYVIPAHGRPTIKVPASVERSGVFGVSVRLSTPGGTQLGPVVDVQVRSTAYGRVALGITFGALTLLFVLVIRRLYRRLRPRPSVHATSSAPATSGAPGSPPS